MLTGDFVNTFVEPNSLVSLWKREGNRKVLLCTLMDWEIPLIEPLSVIPLKNVTDIYTTSGAVNLILNTNMEPDVANNHLEILRNKVTDRQQILDGRILNEKD